MVRKRPSGVVDLSSSGDSENDVLDDVQCSQLPYMDYDSYQSGSGTEVVLEVSAMFVTELHFFVFYFFIILNFYW